MNVSKERGILAREEYNANPNMCQECQDPILCSEDDKLGYIRKKRFCNSSCSAKYNNHKYPKRSKVYVDCAGGCGAKVYRRKYCSSCSLNQRSREIEITHDNLKIINDLRIEPLPLLSTKSRGELSESKIITRLLELGLSVSIPFGDNQRYDLVVDLDSKLQRVQCKTLWMEKDGKVLATSLRSSQVNRVTRTYQGEVDLFALYSPDTDKVYLLREEQTRTNLKLRISETSKQNGHPYRMAKDFEI